ncbi:PQQ-binding-like beta-propeller repeat protein [Microvirga sp. SRT01]|uniref:PQQ-binding-like beta-propeller repeat protein n=1 Tax=Sphingomonas longa TaxID=2778730 RepID=A0ABS2D8K2_9SPHN|nr:MULTISPECIES: PQQ-binding-like beta-propeller repeat protein [Alphaproteobacteria]MBM6577264.1 PQQ-binding-like beta-propeller repeat protein [Sphingomonas sp. BT552]MBR7710308.1 PQQ-binding-like beta-propeller repeat protein [Microvirga sp. SRT01]
MSDISRRHLLSGTAASVFVMTLGARAGAAVQATAASLPDTEWRHYAADVANTRYSPLDQINAANFGDLEIAWSVKTDVFGARKEYQFEPTPLLVKGRLFLPAGSRRDCIALDAASGELLWMHRLDEGQRALNSPRQLSGHGCSYWTDGVKERVLYVTTGYQLVSLDAATGVPDPEFGVNGIVDLKKDFDQELDLETADVGLHATPLVARDTVVVGAAHTAGDVPAVRKNVKGYVRGFDVRTGKRKWIFHTIPKKGEYGYDSWLNGDADEAGNGGVWAEMSADEQLGLVYIPVELPTGDEMGMFRRGNALFGESIVALDLETGVRRWHYQLVHHGLWDRDIPCAPILCDIPVKGRIVKALAQPTKQAFLYVLNRETGKPIWPIVERKVEAGDVPGEWYAPTQPFPSKPPAYDMQGVTIDDLIDFTPELRAEAVEMVKSYKIGPLYTPPVVSKPGRWGTITNPGIQGGTNWPGGCYDPETHTVYVYSKTQPSVVGIVPNTDMNVSEFPQVHGIAGSGVRPQTAMGAPMPAGARPPGAPPAAAGAPPGTANTGAPPVAPPPGGAPGGVQAPPPGYLAVQGLPLLKPPYGRITAIDLTKGDIAWQVAHGETPDNVRNHPKLKGLKIPRTGRAGNLGPLVTKTLVICGEAGFYTNEYGVRGAMLRAYDKATGEEKGAVYMSAPQSGSPMTYRLANKQYIVVAIGGGNYSAELVAYRLPGVA